MNVQRLEELLVAWEENTLTEEECAELKGLLGSDSEARQRLVEAGVLQSVAGTRVQAWDTLPKSQAIPSANLPRKPWALAWLSFRPLMAAAVGVALGMLCTSMVWAYVSPQTAQVVTLMQENFESGVVATIPGLPHDTSMWTGDAAHTVTAEQGLNTESGAKMLRFTSATYEGENVKQSMWSDVYRLVDLRGKVGEGKSTLRLSAAFNAVRYPEEEEYAGSVELCALEEDPSAVPQPLTLPWARENGSSVALRKVPLAGDGRWKQGVVEVPVSPQTRYVLVHLAVLRKKPYPPVEAVQFSGHYVDGVKLELITLPTKD
ncbi:MAG: hypothetical protein ACAH88_15040 [Roseimicrobium sp.]